MLIEIQCRNFSNFDASLGSYVECGEKMIVSDDNIGQVVSCAKCSQPIEVPYDAGVGTSTRASGGEAEAAAAQSIKKDRTSDRPASKQRRPGSDPRVNQRKTKPTGQPAAQRSKKAIQSPARAEKTKAGGDDSSLKLAPAVRRPTSDVMSLDFADEDVQKPLVEDHQERCRKCGNVSEGGRCTICHFVEPNFEKLHLPLDDLEIEIVGFQRWFCQTMSEGVSVKVLEHAAHVMAGLLAAILIFASVLSIFGFGIGVIGGLMLLITVCAGVLLYVGLIKKGHQFLRDPNARLAWFQKPFWYLMLVVSRRMDWQAYDGRFKGRKIITMHDRGFGDRNLANLEGLGNCQVLDLEGTSISDRGLRELYRLKHLRCLVLRHTEVTHDGVFRLQQSFPGLWIWD